MECDHLLAALESSNGDDGFVAVAQAYTMRALPWAATAALCLVLNIAAALYSKMQLDAGLVECTKHDSVKKNQ